jgi:hypothetical protein
VITGPQPLSVRAASRSSTQRAPSKGRAVGLLGDPAGLPGRHRELLDAFPQQREPVDQVLGVADQRGVCGRGHAQPERERLGAERRHRRAALATEGLVGGQHAQRRPTRSSHSGLEVAGFSTAHW